MTARPFTLQDDVTIEGDDRTWIIAGYSARTGLYRLECSGHGTQAAAGDMTLVRSAEDKNAEIDQDFLRMARAKAREV